MSKYFILLNSILFIQSLLGRAFGKNSTPAAKTIVDLDESGIHIRQSGVNRPLGASGSSRDEGSILENKTKILSTKGNIGQYQYSLPIGSMSILSSYWLNVNTLFLLVQCLYSVPIGSMSILCSYWFNINTFFLLHFNANTQYHYSLPIGSFSILSS